VLASRRVASDPWAPLHGAEFKAALWLYENNKHDR
jgi:hypothetical protein